jgi:hypothetical protein
MVVEKPRHGVVFVHRRIANDGRNPKLPHILAVLRID